MSNQWTLKQYLHTKLKINGQRTSWREQVSSLVLTYHIGTHSRSHKQQSMWCFFVETYRKQWREMQKSSWRIPWNNCGNNKDYPRWTNRGWSHTHTKKLATITFPYPRLKTLGDLMELINGWMDGYIHDNAHVLWLDIVGSEMLKISYFRETSHVPGLGAYLVLPDGSKNGDRAGTTNKETETHSSGSSFYLPWVSLSAIMVWLPRLITVGVMGNNSIVSYLMPFGIWPYMTI